MDDNKFTDKEIKRLARAAEFGRQFSYILGFFLLGLFVIGGVSDLAKEYGVWEHVRSLVFAICMIFSVIFLIFIIYICETKYILRCPYCKNKLGYKELKSMLSSKTCKYCNENLITD